MSALALDSAGLIVLPPEQSARREWIVALTNRLLALPALEKREFEVKHTFLPGLYMRELLIPKGSLLVGKIHRLPCLNVVSKGDISVVTELGGGRVQAGYSAPSPAGIQKVGYAHEDTIFVNVFRTDETDTGKIEDVISFSNYEEALPHMPPLLEEPLCQ